MSHGFTLVELMVAMVIALIITIGVVQIFTANRATYQLDEGLARAQENGRFAIEFLAQDIRHAGFLGCNRDVVRIGPSETKINEPFNFLVGSQKYPVRGIRGFEYNSTPTGIGNTYAAGMFPIGNTTAGWGPALDTAIVPGGAQPGSDVIVVERMIPNSWTLVAPFVDADNVHLDPAFVSQVKVDDVLLISDCRQSAVFQVTGITAAGVISHVTGSGTPGNRCGQWVRPPFASTNAAGADCDALFEDPQANIVVGTYQTVTFFVAQGAGAPCGTPGTCQPTLFRSVTPPGGVPDVQALVEGVESLQVLYGVDDLVSDGIADRYVTANNVTNFSLVVSLRIGLLVHGTNATGSSNDIALDKDTHNVAGTIIDPADDKLRRRVFSTTLQLRNRGF
jgi:type IV pilus assembly protein PilW